MSVLVRITSDCAVTIGSRFVLCERFGICSCAVWIVNSVVVSASRIVSASV